MGLVRLLDGLIELIAPTRCAGCDLPGALLCESCIQRLRVIDPAGACPRCGAPFGWLICTECWEREWSFAAGRCVGELERPLSRIVTLYKDGGEQRLAELLATMVVEAGSDWVAWADQVAYVPATEAARRRRSFDHAETIARLVADSWGTRCTTALKRAYARDQRTLDRASRFENAQHTFTFTETIAGNVVLIDDVFTTGATLEAAASALLAAGAREVRVLAVARAW